ncbi:hypothetical protein CK203_098646 [Vitis vinifera]|uniref:Uncharacterized protein n=1 Tax=Vitis vinifera TaxID=29760 RepID=A0A438CMG9_VITVI|nr:hypothetical protein CK203_098646 [Vitis vinifera]
MSSHGPPRNYFEALKTNLKTCAKGTKLRVYTLPVDPLSHKWRVPLSWSHNPSPHVLTFYRDQLDAQTQDQITVVSQMIILNDLEETHRIAIDVLRAIREDHRVHSTHEPSTSSGPSMRPQSLITPVRVPPIKGRGRGGRRASHRHVPLASTLVQPSHPPVTSTFPLFQPSASLESPLSPLDPPISLNLPFFPHVTSIHTFSPPSPHPLPPPSQPSISLDAPPPITESIAPPPVTESIAPPPITESMAPLPFLQGTAHAARLHVRIPRGHRAPRVRRVLPPLVPFNSTTHVDDVSQSIEMETFQIAQMDTTNMTIYRKCSQRKRKIPSCGTH